MHASSTRQAGSGRALILGSILAIALAAGAFFYFACPCERLPGGYLLGQEVSEPVEDWAFANSVPLCQLEVRRLVPHSINLNCMASEGELFVSCANCAGKYWSDAALANPDGRLRLDERVYAVRITRVTDEATLDRAWRARAEKTGAPLTARPEGWWSFQLVSR